VFVVICGSKSIYNLFAKYDHALHKALFYASLLAVYDDMKYV